MKKYIVDTNVWLNSLDVAEKLDDGLIYVPLTVVRELDHQRHQNEKPNLQYMARQTVSYLENLKETNDRVILYDNSHIILPENVYSSPYSINDDLIIQTVFYLMANDSKDDQHILVTNDLGMLLVAETRGIQTRKLIEESDVLFDYKGYMEIYIEDDIVNQLYKFESFDPYRYPELLESLNCKKFINNAFYEIKSSSNPKKTLLCYFNPDTKCMEKLHDKATYKALGHIIPENKEQMYYMHLLQKTDIPCIQIKGKAGSGKAQPLTSKIYTPTGFIKMGKIKVGDTVCSWNGTSKVTGVFPQGEKDVYRLTFSNGSTAESCGEHLWNISYADTSVSDNLDSFETIELNKFKDKIASTKIHIPGKAIEFEERILKVDPYILGVFIAGVYIEKNKVMIHCVSDCVFEKVNKIGKKYIELVRSNQEQECEVIFKDNKIKPIFEYFINNLSIYEEYIYSSVAQRTEFINGIIGILKYNNKYINDNNEIVINTISEKLEKQLLEIFSSLGIYVKAENNTILFDENKKYLNFIEKVEYIGKEECQCIMIDDENHLYYTDGFNITHNTIIATSYALESIENNKFNKFMYIKTLDPVSGKDIGYLPGEKSEKLQPYLAPLYDSLEVLMGANRQEAIAHLESLEMQGKFEMEAISHIRGRSFYKTLLIIDEAENLDISSLKTILTRTGADSRVIILSDDDQIDNPKVSARTNGTSMMKEKLSGDKLYGYIELKSSIRSKFTELVTKLMV